MITVDLKQLLGRLNRFAKQSLENAAGVCVSSGHYEVTIEHVLLKALDDTESDVYQILRYFEIEPARVQRALQHTIEQLKTGNAGKPVFSPLLVEWIEDAWVVSSIELGLTQVRTGALLATLLANPRFGYGPYMDDLARISANDLKKDFFDITAGSKEAGTGQAPAEGGAPAAGAAAGGVPSGDSALARFCLNFTERARQGKIDPVFCRDNEIRQMIDILGRRRKNNPICVGEAGVGKTAVVEGLAVRIVQGDVPDFLKNVDLYSIDLGLLQAGAGVKGEFENRLKGVIDEIKGSPKPLITFIDEAHTLIGAGGSAGGSDAANLLKPALARGELRTVAATTWSEYKKYFEKDPALARRFQLVKLDEPTPEQAVTIIRGLREKFEEAHGVYVRDDAVAAAANLSARYISGRQLPDKAVDVIDTACTRVKLSLSSKPIPIDDKERRIKEAQRELDALKRDRESDTGEVDDKQLADLEDHIAHLEEELATLNGQWEKEKELVSGILDLRQASAIQEGAEAPSEEAAPAEGDGNNAPAAQAAPVVDTSTTPEEKRAEMERLKAELQTVQGRDGLIDYEVTPTAISKVIADWTGIPVGSMVKDEANAVLTFKENLKHSIKGQDQAIDILDEGLRAAKAGLGNPETPIGVFLFVGPSGVGKTETALRVADQMFGGERFVVTINMSEFQDKSSVSRLIGSAPGLVGYGEGGKLTEAVRQRPYSVVLLDESEKADLEVMNLFYQVFDKGTLSDGEGRVVDFKNTIIFLTSNLATDVITQLGMKSPAPSLDEMNEAIRPILSKHFQPALLARMTVVPYFPLGPDAIAEIVQLKLKKVAKRLMSSHKMVFEFTEDVVQAIADRCTEVETGARNIDYIINRNMLPQISTEILEQMGADKMPGRLTVDLDDKGAFAYTFGA